MRNNPVGSFSSELAAESDAGAIALGSNPTVTACRCSGLSSM